MVIADDTCAQESGRVIKERLHTSVAQELEQGLIVSIELAIDRAQPGDLAAGMENGCVVAPAECADDVRQLMSSEFLGKRHRDLAWSGDGA